MNILAEITKELKKRGVKKEINLKTEFKDLGLDSLDLMDLITAAEKQLKFRIPDDKLLEITTVQSLVDIVNGLKEKDE